ncbi:TetR/AcrR family transcriptional regulator [Streptomyces sp. NBC_00536]|uniref:TetR/AcrR family transcriptional regulator n=1 Tax=Streptomyces sp. NBC_00536 TaxID=2975769 RepID=UPI002E810926|nr:TetR/AcrR family transcriptional regulator [Streptomyces sp. NBC_00536]WUC80988.1 TetR/AcrR family transcriptional regulator [Streptomyces sp. NBC_00536]
MRPRTVDDAVILRAAVEVMGRTGPAKLTLAAVARECGLVAGTLVQRFGSKRGMLLALAAHGERDLAGLSERVRAEHASALDALAALIAAAWSPLAGPTAYANHLAFLCADLADPEFRRLALDAQRAQHAAVRELLDLARAELRPGADTGALADAVQAAVTGAGLLWAVDQEGDLGGRQRAALDRVLAPHRRRTHRRHEEDPS